MSKIDTYIYTEKFDIEIFKNHIKFNKPCLIKNFLIKNFNKNDICDNDEKLDVNINKKYLSCGIDSFLKYIKNIELKCADYGCTNESSEKLCCNMTFLDNLINDDKYFSPLKNVIGYIKKVILLEIITMVME